MFAVKTNTPRMKTVYSLLAVLLFCIVPKTNAQSPHDIIGTWLSESRDGKILIYQSGDRFFGKLIWGNKLYDEKGNQRKDLNNPDEQLKNRPLLNLIILSDFIYSDGKWKQGHVYDPKNGKLYDAVLTLKNNQLEIRGYVGIPLFGRSTVWTRSE
jgi:uncharacterized protein (DUF2147 family)